MTSRCARRFCRGTRNSRCVHVPCRLSSILASGGFLTILTYTAYPWIVHVNPWGAGTAGSGITAREVLHSVGMEVEDSGGFRIWQQLRCVHLPHPGPVSPLPSFMRLKTDARRCTVTPPLQVYRNASGRFCFGPPLLEELRAFCSRTSVFNTIHRLLEEPSTAFLTPLCPLPVAPHTLTSYFSYAERIFTNNIQARDGHLRK